MELCIVEEDDQMNNDAGASKLIPPVSHQKIKPFDLDLVE